MDQKERPSPPEELKPWYYQDWFLFPMLVFWPLWPVLIIRSPWHNGIISGAIAWAMIFTGGFLIYLRTQERATVFRPAPTTGNSSTRVETLRITAPSSPLGRLMLEYGGTPFRNCCLSLAPRDFSGALARSENADSAARA